MTLVRYPRKDTMRETGGGDWINGERELRDIGRQNIEISEAGGVVLKISEEKRPWEKNQCSGSQRLKN